MFWDLGGQEELQALDKFSLLTHSRTASSLCPPANKYAGQAHQNVSFFTEDFNIFMWENDLNELGASIHDKM